MACIKKPKPKMSSYSTRLLSPYPPPEKKTQGIASLSVCVQLKGTVPRDFRLLVFLKPLSMPLGPIRLFSNICGDIRSSRCTTGVNDTGGRWKKSSMRKILIFFVLTPLGSRVNIYINICLQVHFKESAD